MIKPVLVDTGCIVALLDRSEEHHAMCAELIRTGIAPLITCEPVIAESIYLLRSLRGAPEAVIKNIENDIFQIPFRFSEYAKEVRSLLKKYDDRPMDFADACLVRMAEIFETEAIATLDSDFDVYRWGRNRRFKNLLVL